ncbi:MAG TPA: toll/interleukin-1 receptor domain-containing protein [Pyrinomonadaceae bacterium]|jgi:hypothetical protein|nr:toll/interleukin-1 receptor domain-containing protein [Pyrinomonadaceae bacterium]
MELGLDVTEQLEDFEQLETTEEPEAADEEQEESEKPPSIFISYNQNPNDERVAAQIYGALSQHYEVFLDKAITPGADYEKLAGDWLERTDFIIVLVSAESVNSQFVLAELETAYERYKQYGRPNVIPVRIAYAGPYSLRLRAYISRFQAIFWDNQDFNGLIEKLQAALSNKPSLPISKSLIVGLDGLLVSANRRARMAETFVAPPELNAAGELLRARKLLWVTGDADVRNYVALSMAAREKAESLFEVTRSRKWSEINNTGVEDSAILLRDTLPATHFNEATAGEELQGLRALIERNNVIIATTSPEDFEQAQQEMRRYEFKDYEQLRVTRNSYDHEAKLRIFGNTLEFSFHVGDINGEQYDWASDLLKGSEETAAPDVAEKQGGAARGAERVRRECRSRFQEIIKKWSPSDIERFITLSLPQVERLGDVAKLLQRNAAVEDEVHSWFLSLDDATRCFLLALAIFPELDDDRLWDKYKQIVNELRRLDPHLPLVPFGICRQRAAPYVSTEGSIYVVDERVAEAIRQEVAKSYREYFIELTERLKEWSVPPGRNPQTQELDKQRKERIEEGRDVRLAVARMVGVVARLGLDDLLEILDYWATDPNYHIRQAVAVALGQTARSQTGVTHALNLLEKWCLDVTSVGPTQRRAWAATIALGSIVSPDSEPFVIFRAINCLNRLTRISRGNVRFYVSITMKQLARNVRLPFISNLLRRLASDEKPEVRINIAEALNRARAFEKSFPQGETETGDKTATQKLLDEWALSTDANLRWVALCCVLTNREGSNPKVAQGAAAVQADKYSKLQELLEYDATGATLASIFSETIKHVHHGEVLTEAFRQLVLGAQGKAWSNLSAGLASIPFNQLDRKLLSQLRSSGTPLLEERVIEIRRDVLSQKLQAPEHFLNTLKEWLNQEHVRLEVYRSLELLLDEEPEGYRQQALAALADCFTQDQKGVSDLLGRLEAMAPSFFAPLSRDVRYESMKRLLHDPTALIGVANEGLERAETFAAMRATLEKLSQNRPQGYRGELFQALAYGFELQPLAVKSLLSKLDASGSIVLRQAAHDFRYRLLEGSLAAPFTLLSMLTSEMAEPERQADTLSLLNQLAAPEPQGKRDALVRSLARARALQQPTVDALLSHPSMQNRTHLAALAREVKRAAFLGKITPKFVTRLFTRRH